MHCLLADVFTHWAEENIYLLFLYNCKTIWPVWLIFISTGMHVSDVSMEVHALVQFLNTLFNLFPVWGLQPQFFPHFGCVNTVVQSQRLGICTLCPHPLLPSPSKHWYLHKQKWLDENVRTKEALLPFITSRLPLLWEKLNKAPERGGGC